MQDRVTFPDPLESMFAGAMLSPRTPCVGGSWWASPAYGGLSSNAWWLISLVCISLDCYT